MGHFKADAVKSRCDLSTLVHFPRLPAGSCHIAWKPRYGGGSLYGYMKQSPLPTHLGLRYKQETTGSREATEIPRRCYLLPTLTTLFLFNDVLVISKMTSILLILQV